MTVTVNVQKGPGGQQIPLPISAMVPATIQPQDLQLCASLSNGSESCQPLSGGQQAASIDLTQPAAGAAGATPAPTGAATPMPAPAPQSYPNNGGKTNAINSIIDTITSVLTVQSAYAQLISVEDTTVNIPITVIVPIDLNIQNAQICASVASSGDQSCTQVVMNPEQTSYTDVDVDLSSATPTLTTAEQEPTTAEPTTATAPTTEEPTVDTGTEEGGTTTEEPSSDTEEPSGDTSTEEGGTPTEEPSADGSTSEGSTEQ
jgi:hypothetical protein